MSEPASSILKLKFCNSSKVYQLYSPNKSSPHLTVRPTLVLDDASLRKSGKQGSYKQVIPGVVDSFTNRARNEAGPPNQVAIKWARGKETIARLACELRFYETELRTLQGAIVPRCYGAYIGEVDGYEVACLVLEWCAGEMTRDHFELNRQRMVAAAKIHTAGIIHGALFDKRHWVVGPDSRLRIVDFSKAPCLSWFRAVGAQWTIPKRMW